MTQQIKIEGKFYPLKNEEWLNIARKLTHSELLVLYHLRTLEPFGDKLTESSTKDVAEATGISQRSVQRALIKLNELELIDLQIQKFAFRLRSQSQTTEESDSDSAVANSSAVSPTRQPCRDKDSAVANSSPLSDSSSETLAPRDFFPPKTLKTNKTNQTLSESEGERNLIFWKNLDEVDKTQIRKYAYTIAIPKLPLKPTRPDSWISRHCMELFNQIMIDAEFQKSSSGKCSENSSPVENQPATPKPNYFSIADLQKMYGADWKNAAVHFGIKVSDDFS